MVDLENAARSPPTGRLLLRHGVIRTSYAWLLRTHVVGDGSRKDNWGRQFGGIGAGEMGEPDPMEQLEVDRREVSTSS